LLHEVRKHTHVNRPESPPRPILGCQRGISVGGVLSYFYKMNTFVLGVLMGKPESFVMDKKSDRDLFHAFPNFSFPSFSSRIPAEVSFG
jgi:hypothetical protein